MFQLTYWTAPALIVALGCMFLYRRIYRQRDVPGVSAFLLVLFTVILWSLIQGVETLLTTSEHKLLASQLAFACIQLTPIAWLAFCLNHARSEQRMPRSWLFTASLLPLAAIAGYRHGVRYWVLRSRQL